MKIGAAKNTAKNTLCPVPMSGSMTNAMPAATMTMSSSPKRFTKTNDFVQSHPLAM